MNLITREELKARIDSGDDFKLVMVLSEWAFRAKHIPGSLNIDNPAKATELLSPDDDIVLYCSDPACPASKFAYQLLTGAGYEKVSRYAGGITDWEENGLPLEGEWAEEPGSGLGANGDAGGQPSYPGREGLSARQIRSRVRCPARRCVSA